MLDALCGLLWMEKEVPQAVTTDQADPHVRTTSRGSSIGELRIVATFKSKEELYEEPRAK